MLARRSVPHRTVLVVAFEVARQPAISADPGENPLNDPAFWQDDGEM